MIPAPDVVASIYPGRNVLVTGADGFTLQHIHTMATHWKFQSALGWTVLLAAVVVPIQLVLALAMASIVSNLKSGRSTVLYIFSIPLGLSDLAAGIVWLAIFEQSGFLNSMLMGLGLVEQFEFRSKL